MSLTPTERRLLEGISRRSAALQRFADLTLAQDRLLPVVVAFIGWNLIRTIFLLAGRELADEYLKLVFRKLQDDAGICDLCGALKDDLTAVACATCLQQFADEDRDIDIQEAMDKKTGAVS